MGETSVINSGMGGPHDNYMLQKVTEKREISETLQMQVATNEKYTDFGGMGASTASYVSMSGEKTQKEAFLDNLKFVMSGFKETQTTLASLSGIAVDFRQLAAQVRDGLVEGLDIKTQARDMLNTVAGYLNNSISGQFIFAGSDSLEPPVDLNLLPDPNNYNLDPTDDNSADSLLYFKGNGDIKHVRASSSQLKPIAATANQLQFQRLIRAAHILSTADPTDLNYRQKIAEVVRLADQSVDGIRSKSSELGQTDLILQRVAKDNRNEIQFLERTLKEMNYADPIETLTKFIAFGPQQQATAQALKTGMDSTTKFMALMSQL